MNIAIKLPNSLREIIYCFPLLHELHRRHIGIDCNIHLISGSNEIEILNLLPFKAFFHQFDYIDSKSAFRIFRAYKNSKLYLQEFDIYIDTTTSSAGAVLGLFIKSKRRIGFCGSPFEFLFTDKVIKLQSRNFSEQIFKLLDPLFESINENDIKNIASREFLSEKDIDSYIVIDRDLFDDDNWHDFIDLVDRKKIIVYGDNLKGIKHIDKRNYIEFAKLLFLSQGYITQNFENALVCSYVGTTCFYLNHSQRREDQFNYYIGKLYDYNINNPEFRDLNFFNFGKIFDSIYSNLPRKIKEK